MSQSHILVGSDTELVAPTVRKITTSDVWDALAKGWDDFSAMPSHAIFLCVIYPIIGVALVFVVAAGLKAHGIKRRIAIMEPYYPCIEPRLNAVLGAHGYEIVRFCHMRGKSPASPASAGTSTRSRPRRAAK